MTRDYTRVQQVPLTQTLWCGGNRTSKSSLDWTTWSDNTWLWLSLLRLLRDSSVWDSRGLVKSDLWGNLLDTTLIDVMWSEQAPWTQLETYDEEWYRDTHTLTETYTHRGLPLSHWHILVIVTDTHQHYYRSWFVQLHDREVTQAYRLSINYW